MDALHVVAAASVGAEELATTEKVARSIHRSRAVKIVTIHPANDWPRAASRPAGLPALCLYACDAPYFGSACGASFPARFR